MSHCGLIDPINQIGKTYGEARPLRFPAALNA
jgi:hypothetical protein